MDAVLEQDEGGALATMEADASTVALLNRSEIDQQVRTAKQYPRSIKGFRDEVLQLATLSQEAAEECTYALQRKNADGTKKTIIGPSARFAEIVFSAWTNCRAGARVIDDKGDHVTAQGAFLDLQKNVALTYEVQRRVTDSKGRRYSADMVSVTANAACSIAMRNAVLKGVPRAMWKDLWDKSREVAVGDVTTLSNRRTKLLERFVKYGVDEAQVLAKLGRPSVADITLDDIEILMGLGTSIKDGEITPEEAFAVKDATDTQAGTITDLNKKIAEANGKGDAKKKPPPPPEGPKTEAGVVTFAKLVDRMQKAKDLDVLDADADLIKNLPADQQSDATAVYKKRRKEIEEF